jgi:hypothetical protein
VNVENLTNKQIGAMVVAGVVIYVSSWAISKKISDYVETKRKARLEKSGQEFETYIGQLNEVIQVLDEKIETAKFWELVTRDD